MPEARVERLLQAIRESIANILWKSQAEELVRDDPKMKRFPPEAVRRMLHQHILNGGIVTERREGRKDDDKEDRVWYRAVLQAESFPRGLFVEMLLRDEDKDDVYVIIVSAHEQPG